MPEDIDMPPRPKPARKRNSKLKLVGPTARFRIDRADPNAPVEYAGAPVLRMAHRRKRIMVGVINNLAIIIDGIVSPPSNPMSVPKPAGADGKKRGPFTVYENTNPEPAPDGIIRIPTVLKRIRYVEEVTATTKQDTKAVLEPASTPARTPISKSTELPPIIELKSRRTRTPLAPVKNLPRPDPKARAAAIERAGGRVASTAIDGIIFPGISLQEALQGLQEIYISGNITLEAVTAVMISFIPRRDLKDLHIQTIFGLLKDNRLKSIRGALDEMRAVLRGQ